MKRLCQKLLSKYGLFHRHKTCTGYVLFKWGQRMAELWICPANFKIERHSHPLEHVELFPLLGHSEFFRERPNGEVQSTGSKCFKLHTVPAGWYHWFTVTPKRSLVFINFSRWTEGFKPTSAAEDFNYAK